MSEGKKFDQGKLRFSLLPFQSVEDVVQVLEYGAKKYAPDNWRKVSEPRQRYFDAALRHLWAWKKGERLDPESGLSHLAHAACSLLFLLHFDQEEPPKYKEPTEEQLKALAPEVPEDVPDQEEAPMKNEAEQVVDVGDVNLEALANDYLNLSLNPPPRPPIHLLSEKLDRAIAEQMSTVLALNPSRIGPRGSFEERKGDAIHAFKDRIHPGSKPPVLAHGCNDAGMWGAGFSGALSRAFPEPEFCFRAERMTLGEAELVSVRGRGGFVFNLCTQHQVRRLGGRPPIRYTAVVRALLMMCRRIPTEDTVILPRIGAGLGGGDWTFLAMLIERVLCLHRGLNVEVYSLEGS